MTDRQIAQQVLDNVGGKNNIISNMTCMTRLRLVVKEQSKIQLENLKKIDGVFGIVKQENGVQIVFGPAKVNDIGQEFAQLTEIKLNDIVATVDDVNTIAKENKQSNKEKYNGPIQRFLEHIANVFVPLLPGIIAAGLINGLSNVINVTTHNAYQWEWWYQAIRTMGWGLFTFLPIYVGFNATKEFKGTPILGGIAGAMSVSVSSMPLLMKIDTKIVTMPLTKQIFNPTSGGLFAALMMGIVVAYLERYINKFMPNMFKSFFTPLFTLIFGAILSIVIIQPFGAFLTKGIFSIMDFIYVQLGVVGGYILSASFLPIVSVGLHQALTPIHVMLNNPDGPTHGINYLLPILMMAGGGQIGAGLAIMVKSKNKRVKQLTRNALPVGILGIGEPLMYAVTLPLGKPFITACLGSGLGGILSVLFHLGTVTQGVSGIFGALIVQSNLQILFIIAMLGAYVGGFILTLFFGVDDDRINEVYGE